MGGEERAARIAAQTKGDLAQADARSVVALPLLGIVVKRGEVYARGQLRDRHLGPLAGACAGVLDVRPSADAANAAARAVLGLNSPRTGTVFVAMADDTRHVKALRAEGRAEMREVAISRFNAMADAASRRET